MLALLSDVLHRGGIDVLSVCHGGNANTSISDALGRDELLIQLSLGLSLLHHLNLRLVLTKTADHIEVLGLDNMVLFSL